MKLIRRILSRKVYILNVHYNTNTSFDINGCLLSALSGKVQLEKKFQAIDKLADVAAQIPDQTPIELIITGRVVLNKVFNNGAQADLAKELPTINLKDFYRYCYQNFDSHCYSLVKKEVLDKLLQEIKQNNIVLSGVKTGVFHLAGLWSFIGDEQNSLAFRGNDVKLLNGNIQLFVADRVDKNNTAGKLNINEELLLAYAVGLEILSRNSRGAFIDETPEGIEADFRFKKWFLQSRYPVLAGVLVLLIVNYLFFDKFNKTSEYYSGANVLNKTLIARLDSLQSELNAKNEFLQYTGRNKTSYGVMLDMIAASVPRKIVLSEWYINPIKKVTKESEPLVPIPGMRVKGKSGNSYILNEWVKELHALPWVENVEILNYEYNDELRVAEFEIKMSF